MEKLRSLLKFAVGGIGAIVSIAMLAGCSDEEIAMLCDIAMCGDHGIGECYGSVLDLPKCIAKGDDMCCLRYHKKEQ